MPLVPKHVSQGHGVSREVQSGMRGTHYTLIAGIVLGVVGFAVAVFIGDRRIGMNIFLVGFFAGAGASVCIVLSSRSRAFGGIGTPIKIASGGFGLILIGQLIDFLLDKSGTVGNTLFFVGIVVMVIGILAAAFQKVKF